MSSDGEDAAAAAAAGGGSEDDAGAADAGGEEDGAAAAASARRRKGSVLSAAKLEKLQARYDKRGVVYISRVPPFMKPAKLRHLLEQHGEVLRLYLAAEGARTRNSEGRGFRGGFLCVSVFWWLTRRVRARRRDGARAAQEGGRKQRQEVHGRVRAPRRSARATAANALRRPAHSHSRRRSARHTTPRRSQLGGVR
jgi:hypothetical protein